MAAKTDTVAPRGAFWLSRERAFALALIAVTAAVLYLCYLLVRPFLTSLAWALALAVVGYPVHRRIAQRVRNPGLAAAISVVAVALIVVAPAIVVANELLAEAANAVEIYQQGGLSRWETVARQYPRLGVLMNWAVQHLDLNREFERMGEAVTARIGALVSGSLWAMAELLITFFVLFYFFRDRRKLLRGVRSLVPLAEDETDELFDSVANTIYATLFGIFVVGMAQGATGGFMFWLVGLPAPLTWGLIMAILAVIPLLGAFLIWAPAAIYLMLTGDWVRGLILFSWGLVVVSLIDNILYPIIVGKRLHVHTVPVFFAIVGGLSVFGAAGLVLGPVVLATAIGLIHVWRRRTGNGGGREQLEHSSSGTKKGSLLEA
ncbi:MAG: AI-2E family transporter [Bryobacteraceae bacterium]